MPRLDDADEAIQRLSGHTIGDRQLTVNEAQDDRPNGPRNSDQNNRRGEALKMFSDLLAD